MLSAAKHLRPARREMLRCAQHDRRDRPGSKNPTSERGMERLAELGEKKAKERAEQAKLYGLERGQSRVALVRHRFQLIPPSRRVQALPNREERDSCGFILA